VVATLVRLRLRLAVHGLDRRAVTRTATGGFLGLVFAVATAVLSAGPFPTSAAAAEVVSALHALWLGGWFVAPFVVGAGERMLDPRHFVTLPIGRTKLAVGFLAAGLPDIAPVVTLIAFSGLTVGAWRSGPSSGLEAVVILVLETVLVVTVSRVVLLLAAIGSRTRRDELIAVLAASTSLSGIAVRFLSHAVGPALVAGRLPALSVALRVLPSGWGPRALELSASGRWGGSLGLVAALAGLVATLVVVWGWLLERAGTTAPGSARTSAPRRRAAWAPPGPIGAVVVKETRLWLRDPPRRTALISVTVLGLVLLVAPAALTGSPWPAAWSSIVVIVGFCVRATNLYGLDGRSFGHLLCVPGPERADTRGRQAAWLLITAPPVLVLGALGPAVASAPSAYLWLGGLIPALLGGGCGIVALTSALLPHPVARSLGARSATVRPLPVLLCLTVLALTSLPVVGLDALGVVTGSRTASVAGVGTGLAVGAALACFSGTAAIGRLRSHGPDIRQAVLVSAARGSVPVEHDLSGPRSG
jgi:ABC-2 type transport system permease protein